MCVSLGPAKLSDTILYGAEVLHPDSGKVIHVSGYQNRAVNLGDGPNAMILPFPAMPESMSQHNVVDTKDCPHILEDMEAALKADEEMSLSFSTARSLSMPKAVVFRHGIYTIVLAEDASAIPGALYRVEESRRPLLNKSIFEAYSQWYPSWAIALCCFSNKDASDATPMLWWYEPSDPGEIFFPTLDCHTGAVPDLTKKVKLDHTIAIGSYLMEDRASRAKEVDYSDPVPESVRPFLVNKVVGSSLGKFLPRVNNGDFFVDVNDLRQGTGILKRRNPLGVEGWV